MYRPVLIAALALTGWFSGGTVHAGCGCGCGARARVQPAVVSGQPAFGPGSYRFWDRRNNCWLFYDAATRGTYFWSPLEQRYQPMGGAPSAPSSNDQSGQQPGQAATSAAASCPHCAAVQAATPSTLPPLSASTVAPSAAPGAPGDGRPGSQPGPVARGGSEELLPSPRQAALLYGGQKLCPVTDDELGSMGKPIAVTVRGQTIWVCCRGCVAKVQREPDKYLRKVAQELAAQQSRRP